MKSGQIVRFKPSSPLAKQWGLDEGSSGEVICSYQGKSGYSDTGDRIDVRFQEDTVIWAAPAAEFEMITDNSNDTPDAIAG